VSLRGIIIIILIRTRRQNVIEMFPYFIKFELTSNGCVILQSKDSNIVVEETQVEVRVQQLRLDWDLESRQSVHRAKENDRVAIAAHKNIIMNEMYQIQLFYYVSTQ
jgi:hypothetical protein